MGREGGERVERAKEYVSSQPNWHFLGSPKILQIGFVSTRLI